MGQTPKLSSLQGHVMDPTLILIGIGIEIALTIFGIVMVWRFVKAHEGISRHLLEIARDLKKISDHMGEKDE